MTCKILVVDDVYDMRLLLKNVLTASGFLVLEAENGINALNMLESDPEISLILLDIGMPGMDGLTLMKKIKHIKTKRNLTVCFVTGKKDKSDIEYAVQLGCDDYITKPVDPMSLVEKVKSLVQLKCKETQSLSIGADFSADVLGLPVHLQIRLLEITERAVEFECLLPLQVGREISWHSPTFAQLIQSEEPCTCLITACKPIGKDVFLAHGDFIQPGFTVIHRLFTHFKGNRIVDP